MTRTATTSAITIPATAASTEACTGIDAWGSYTEYGTPSAGTTPSGTVTGPLGYGWLGADQRATGPDTASLALLGVRYYNPVTGAFTSPDPVPGGNDTSYGYPGDPINGTDLTGQCWSWVCGTASAVGHAIGWVGHKAEQVVLVTGRRDRLDAIITAMAADSEFTTMTRRLGCLRGIGTLSEFALAVEINDWDWFTGASIGAYLGLVPSEHSFGATRAQGGITKTGNTHVRRLLVEAAWHHRKPYRPTAILRRRWEQAPPPVVARAQAGNRRLHQRWTRYAERKKRPVVATELDQPSGRPRWRGSLVQVPKMLSRRVGTVLRHTGR